MKRFSAILGLCILSVNGSISLIETDPGEPLFLTPLIKSGEFEKARNSARINHSLIPDSYAGFFTVDDSFSSNQFLWYFPTESKKPREPLIIYLGGPLGHTSLFGLFEDHGPIQIEDGEIHPRVRNWAGFHHLAYIDTPVGAGFSFTNDSQGYCTNQTQIGEHLYSIIVQFLQMFPDLQKSPIFISGDLYGAKYAVALAHTIHQKKEDKTGNVVIELSGLLIGSGWMDPINQMDYAEHIYQIGLIDWNQRKKIEMLQKQTIDLINQRDWHNATKTYISMIWHISDDVGLVPFHNYVKKLEYECSPVSFCFECPFCLHVRSNWMRKAIHVGNVPFNHHNQLVDEILSEDILQSVSPWISELLDHYKILFYSGQLDLFVPYHLIVHFLRNLESSSKLEYEKAQRRVFTLDPIPDFSSGITFEREAGNITEVLFKNSGHFVGKDDPLLLQLVTYEFTHGWEL